MGLFKRKSGDDTEQPAPPPPPPATGGMDLDAMRRQAEQLSAAARQGGLTRGNVRDLEAYARSAQAQAQQQMAALQQSGALEQFMGGQGQGTAGGASGETGTGALLRALGIEWSSDYTKRVQCPNCGGPKKLASPSAYVYCDFCGALADYDFRRACSDSLTLPAATEYAQTVNGLQPEAKAALATGDKDRYREIKRHIYEAYARFSPHSLSHRIADPDYREKLVEFMAESNVATDFDPQYAALLEEMKSKTIALPWSGGMTSPRTGGPAFRALVEVCERQAARVTEVVNAAGLVSVDPDHANDTVRMRMFRSAFSQGWLPMLSEEDAAWMIDRLDLNGEYARLEPPPDAESRSCGGCGGSLTVLPGAKTVVCDFCGKSIDVGGGQLPCSNCGAGLSFPVGVSRLECPYCKTATERIGLT